jgi:hypothetical protein
LLEPWRANFLSVFWFPLTLTLFHKNVWTLKMSGKISFKGWTARMRRRSVRMKHWKMSFVIGHHIEDKHWQELVICYIPFTCLLFGQAKWSSSKSVASPV